VEENTLIISNGEDLGSFVYRVKGKEDYYTTPDLNGLVKEIKNLEIEYIQEKPIYSNIASEDRQILEGYRKQLLRKDLIDSLEEGYQI
tara:strand:+ start:312 stop:575 length:264 start_codon:yes stop_codon:yes gene_type:complete